MNLNKTIFYILILLFFSSCADYRTTKTNEKDAKKYYSSSGFALIYDTSMYEQKIVNKKINNDKLVLMHRTLRSNTTVRITNPENSKSLDAKIYRKADFPKILNVVISKKVASILDLDLKNPYIELNEIKKNKTFIAKKSNTFDEEKNVAEKAPVDEVEMNVLSDNESNTKQKTQSTNSYIIVINEFYYEDSANNLKNELIKKTKMDNIFVKKINNKKYRLYAGPFKNFNALKSTYISLNNLGFDNLDIYNN